jgi:hypothetical protein
MLSDHERDTLRKIQHQLSVVDADFERSFHALERPPVPPTRHRLTYTAVIVIAMLLGAVLLFAGSPAGALAFMVTAGSAWIIQHARNGASQRKRGD